MNRFLKTIRAISAALAVLTMASAARAQTVPPVWNNVGSYSPGDMVTDYGNVYRCLKPVTTHYLDPSKSYAYWQLFYVRNNTTIVIGVNQPFPDLATAWTYVENCSVAEGVYLHLSISTANGLFSENFTGQGFSLDHPSGASISIIGDNPDNINLGGGGGFTYNGFVVDSGHGFGGISNVTINGPGNVVGSPGCAGILATGNGSVASVSNVDINNFHDGVYAGLGGNVNLSSAVTISGVYDGVEAEMNGTVSIYGGWTETSASHICLYAHTGGYISARQATVSGGYYGIEARDGGTIECTSTTQSGAVYGVAAEFHGFVKFDSSEASGNNLEDLEADGGGVISAIGATGANKHADSSSVIMTSGGTIP